MPRLSAGRVQSVATRMVVERERARMAFRSAGWWGIDATFTAEGEAAGRRGRRVAVVHRLAGLAVDGDAAGPGQDFDETGVADRPRVGGGAGRGGGPGPGRRARRARPSPCASMTHKPFRRSPSAPFMTSTLQQEAGRKLRFSSKRTMQVAQHLYEEGWITYMRTDSTTLSEPGPRRGPGPGPAALRPRVRARPSPAATSKKVKNAQEAHEAIRPAGETFRTPDEAARSLSGDEFRLYDLIWKRTVASQMADATGTSAQVRLVGHGHRADGVGGRRAEFAASGKVIEFPGFLRAYVEGEDDPEAELADREVHLPPMAEGDPASAVDLEPGVARHPAAGPLHRGLAGQGHGGARRGAALHLRQRHRHHPRPGLRLEEGHGPGAVASPPSPWSACWSSTSPTWWTTGSPPRWRTTSTRSPAATRSTALADPLLLRRTGARRPTAATRAGNGDGAADGANPSAWASSARSARTSARSTPGRSTPSPSARRRRPGDRGPGRAATARTCSRARTGSRSPRTWPPTS